MKRVVLTAMFVWLAVFCMPILVFGTAGMPPANVQAPLTTQATDAAANTTTAATDAAGTTAAVQANAGYDSTVTISLLVDDKVIYLPLDAYLRGVVAAEMPASFPAEALKAQAIAARTSALYKLWRVDEGDVIPARHRGALVCADPGHCSAYRPIDESFGAKWEEYAAVIAAAVADTDGRVVVYEGEPIVAAFHAVSGGRTERAEDVWGGSVPYLQSVDSPGEEGAPKYSSVFELSAAEFANKFKAARPEADLADPPENWFKNSTRSEAGSILEVFVGGVAVSGRDIRSLLNLNSADFIVEVIGSGKTALLRFTCSGYGHGVGLSQYGARAMADSGASAEEILAHYYTGTTVEKRKPGEG